MVAGERRRRSIVQDCKYRPIARIIQHKQAKAAVARYLCEPDLNVEWLTERAEQLREAIADDDFDRLVHDNNADYVDRFASVAEGVELPKASVNAQSLTKAFVLNGVSVSPQISFQLNRTNKNNKVRIGGCSIRYAKGKFVEEECGKWQAAFTFGYLGATHNPDEQTPEQKLCLVLDAYAGKLIAAPTDSVTRFNEMSATCATVREWWPNIEAPRGARI